MYFEGYFINWVERFKKRWHFFKPLHLTFLSFEFCQFPFYLFCLNPQSWLFIIDSPIPKLIQVKNKWRILIDIFFKAKVSGVPLRIRHATKPWDSCSLLGDSCSLLGDSCSLLGEIPVHFWGRFLFTSRRFLFTSRRDSCSLLGDSCSLLGEIPVNF